MGCAGPSTAWGGQFDPHKFCNLFLVMFKGSDMILALKTGQELGSQNFLTDWKLSNIITRHFTQELSRVWKIFSYIFMGLFVGSESVTLPPMPHKKIPPSNVAPRP